MGTARYELGAFRVLHRNELDLRRPPRWSHRDSSRPHRSLEQVLPWVLKATGKPRPPKLP